MDTPSPQAWLERGSNREEWGRLRLALELGDGFQFFCVQTGDRLAEAYLGELLSGFCERESVTLVEIKISGVSTVAGVVERLRTAPKPALFWIHLGKDNSSPEGLFSLLNQKREVISTLANSPLIMAMHPQDWARFRRQAPDFWSIHQTVSRFAPGAEPMPASRPSHPPTLRARGSTKARASNWRLSADDLARLAPPNFFGRASEINFLVSELESPGARILICGPAGSGKTALLRYVAPRIADFYPAGVWWVSVNAVAGGTWDRAGEILERLTLELIPNAGRHTGLGELSHLFRIATESIDALFVFEDIDDLAIVETLIPGVSSSMVVTTRLGPQAGLLDQVFELDGLGIEAGVQLLQARTRLDVETARRVASAASSLPSVLTLSGAILADQPQSAGALIKQLKSLGSTDLGGDDDVQTGAGIERVLDGQTAEARALWPKLGLFRGEFGPVDAAAVSGLELGDLESLLDELVRAGLIERMASPEIYRVLPLFYGIADRLLNGRDDAEDTWFAYARRVLIGRSTREIDQDVRAAVDWLRARYVADQSQSERVWSIVEAAIGEWSESGSSDYVMQLALEIGELRHELRPLADVYDSFGAIALQRGRFFAAEAWYRRKLKGADELGDRALKLSALIGLGDAALARNEPDLALERYQAALTQGSESLAPSQMARLYTKMGSVAISVWDDQSAELYYRSALKQAESAGLDDLIEIVYRGLASTSFNQHNYDDSEAYVRRILASAETDGRSDHAALADLGGLYGLMGSIQQARGRYEDAATWYEKALAAFERDADLANATLAQLYLAKVAMSIGDLMTAKSWYETALTISGRLGDWVDWVHLIYSLPKLGELAARQGHIDVAEDICKRWYESAPEQIKPRLREAWEDAGLAWPEDRSS